MKRKSGRGRGRAGSRSHQGSVQHSIRNQPLLGAAREEITRSQYIENLVEAAALNWRRNAQLSWRVPGRHSEALEG
jgi:hypothetical protein